MTDDDRPIRPAGQALLRAFAGRHPGTGQAPGEMTSELDELDEFLLTQVCMLAVPIFDGGSPNLDCVQVCLVLDTLTQNNPGHKAPGSDQAVINSSKKGIRALVLPHQHG